MDLNDSVHRLALEESWQIFHLLVPVVSSTFASFSRMYRGMGRASIDQLFIDEAGQAPPQSAVGAIWRAKKVIVVGDPAQIEPVVTVDKNLFTLLKNGYGLSEIYLSPEASVQNLADLANKYGTIKKDGSRIGVPLWVHRRCADPMFHVSNEISYGGKMVQGIDKSGKMTWYDVKGKTLYKQFVEEHAEKLLELIKEDEDIDKIYVITPFKEVVFRIKKYPLSHASEFTKVSKEQLKGWAADYIGTVHTFQGKEADVVYFICGTDEEIDGAANWSCQSANILNVAVTRAKKEFYIIGDYDRYKVKQNYQAINENLSEKYLNAKWKLYGYSELAYHLNLKSNEVFLSFFKLTKIKKRFHF